MAKVTVKIPQIFVPDVSKETGPATQNAVRQLFATAQQHEQAFASLKAQVDQKASSTNEKAAASATTSAATAAPTAAQVLSVLGTHNGQLGNTYSVQDGDYGGIITFGNSNAVAVTLNSAVRQNWFAAIENLGPSVVTLTPDQRVINSAPSLSVPPGTGVWVFFDGMVWWATTTPLAPQTIAAVMHEFLTGYDASTGTFTLAQPSFADISGKVSPSQLPPSSPSFVDYEQQVPAMNWVIQHNLNTYPSVTAVDQFGQLMQVDVQYDSKMQVTLEFSTSMVGHAHLV